MLVITRGYVQTEFIFNNIILEFQPARVVIMEIWIWMTRCMVARGSASASAGSGFCFWWRSIALLDFLWDVGTQLAIQQGIPRIRIGCFGDGSTTMNFPHILEDDMGWPSINHTYLDLCQRTRVLTGFSPYPSCIFMFFSWLLIRIASQHVSSTPKMLPSSHKNWGWRSTSQLDGRLGLLYMWAVFNNPVDSGWQGNQIIQYTGVRWESLWINQSNGKTESFESNLWSMVCRSFLTSSDIQIDRPNK